MIYKLTWRNLWRNRRRTIITIASISFAVLLAIVMKSLQNGVFDNLIKNVVGFYSGYIQVHKNGYWNEQILENSFVLDDSFDAKLKLQHVNAVVPRLESFVLASSGNTTKGCMIVGTDPAKENVLTSLQSKLISGNYINNDDEAVLIAEGLSQRLNISTGDTIVLLGQGYQGNIAAAKFPVKGIVKFGQPQLNDGLIYLPLVLSQQFLSSENMATSLAFALDDPTNQQIVEQQLQQIIGKDYEVMTWQQMMPEIENHIRADSASFYIWTGILYLIIAFGIFGTILMMTAERKYEFGMLVAIGMKKIRLALMLLSETLMISICGAAAGIILSVPVVLYLEKNPIRFSGQMAKAYEQFGFEPIFPANFNLDVFISQSLFVLMIAIVIGLYPLWFVKRLNPVTAMRK